MKPVRFAQFMPDANHASHDNSPKPRTQSMSSYTRQLAEFAANLKLEDVPEEVVARAKGIILDGLGCGLFAADVKWTQILARVVGQLEPSGGRASIWGRGETASAVHAALVNGTMVQG